MPRKTFPINNATVNGIPQPARPRTQASSRQRVTVSFPLSLVERLRNAVYWTEQRTLAQIVVDAIEDALAAMEHANGGPFPERLAPLRTGRRPRIQPPSCVTSSDASSGVYVTG